MSLVFWILSLFGLVAAMLPMWRIPHGLIRVFDFPRLNLLALGVFTLALGLLIGGWTWLDLAAFVACIVAIIIQLYEILPFTHFAKRQSEWVGEPDRHDASNVFDILVCNVKQGNTDHQKLAKLIEKREADFVLLMEVDHKWEAALEPVLRSYENRTSHVLDNSYGMLLASSFPLRDAEVRFLLNDQVPSIHARIVMPSGRSFFLRAIHPEPPVPYADSVGRDAEIALVGKLVCDTDGPVIVAGDLNDVAWSRTTARFLRQTGLRDLRRGFGMLNTFHADYWFLRWPLDHLFHSSHFAAIEVSREPHVGSDHFPMYYRLQLRGMAGETTSEGLSDGEQEAVDQMIETEKQRDEDPVGTDWEK